jgi:DNA polymerase-3 subunit gamma/tau
MRDSTHAQVLLEMAVVRLARLDELLPVGALVTALSQGGVASTMFKSGTAREGSAPVLGAEGAKKNGQPVTEPGLNANGIESSNLPQVLTESSIPEVWRRLNRYLSEKAPILANHLKGAILPAIFAPNSLAIRFSAEYNQAYEACDSEANLRRIEEALSQITGTPIKAYFELVADSTPGVSPPPAATAARVPEVADRKKQLMGLPLFRRAGESLGALIWHVDDDFNPIAPPRPTPELESDPSEI